MSDLGFGAGGVAEGLQLVQALQTGKIDQQQRQVQLEMSQLQLDNTKKLQAALGAHSFGNLSGPDGQQNTNALFDLANVYLSANSPQQAKAVTDIALNAVTSKAYAAEQQAAATKKYIDMAEDLFSRVSGPEEWRQAQMFMQSQLPPEAMQNPNVKALLTSEYSPDKVRIMPGFLENLRIRAQAHADQSRAAAEEARTRYYKFEDDLDVARGHEAEARADYYRQHGAGDLVPKKDEIEAAANDLQELYPEPEAQPVVQGGKITDTTAARANYKARVNARATEIAEAAKSYVKQGMKPDQARKRALEEAKARGDLKVLEAPVGTPTRAPAGSPIPPKPGSAAAIAESWGEPTQVP